MSFWGFKCTFLSFLLTYTKKELPNKYLFVCYQKGYEIIIDLCKHATSGILVALKLSIGAWQRRKKGNTIVTAKIVVAVIGGCRHSRLYVQYVIWAPDSIDNTI